MIKMKKEILLCEECRKKVIPIISEEKMSGNDNYVICMMPRATLIKDVDKMLSVASEYQKTVVGTVAM